MTAKRPGATPHIQAGSQATVSCDWCHKPFKLSKEQDWCRRTARQIVFFCSKPHSDSYRGYHRRLPRPEWPCALCGTTMVLTNAQNWNRATKGRATFFCGYTCSALWKWDNTEVRQAVSASYDTNSSRGILSADNGKTAGRPGFFYIARFPGYLKFGSTSDVRRRWYELKHQHGTAPERVLIAQVPDAGAYEAMMMERYREHWIGGERFRDFLPA